MVTLGGGVYTGESARGWIMRGFELSEKYFVAEMEFESFELTGGETAVGREVPAKEHRLGFNSSYKSWTKFQIW